MAQSMHDGYCFAATHLSMSPRGSSGPITAANPVANPAGDSSAMERGVCRAAGPWPVVTLRSDMALRHAAVVGLKGQGSVCRRALTRKR
jgi:hypothetical protein